MEMCKTCKVEMKKGTKLNSGNSVFQEWVCPKCSNKVMKAVGVN